MWGPLDIQPDSCLSIRLNPLEVYVRRLDDEWLFAHSYDEADEGDIADQNAKSSMALPPQNMDWLRFVSARDESLELLPVLPDRPLVIRPDSPVAIFPERVARIFVSVPVWFRFVAVLGKSRTNVIDFPSRMLSNTWFGDPASGELCYSLDAPLTRSPEQVRFGASSVTCILVVRNSSEEKLDFERICVHVENLSIFEDGEKLWTNEVEVAFKGTDQISQIDIQDRPPSDLPDAKKITQPRVVLNSNILRRSYSFIRQFTGF